MSYVVPVAAPIDLLTADAVADPHATFAALRDRGPVVWSDTHRAWIITGYDGVAEAFLDSERLSSDRLTPYWARLSPDRAALLGTTFDVLRGWMVFHDPPRHALLRNPVRRAFTPRQVQRLAPGIERIAAELLDGIAERGECDLKAEFAFPLPALVIADLMGVEGAERHRFKDWSAKLAAIVFGESDNPRRDARAAEGSAEFVDYFSWLVRHRREHPGEDLVSALLAAQAEEGAGELSELELVGACTLLLFAGHETTTNLLANSALALLGRPDQAALLRSRPETVDTAVEELIRFDGPVKTMVRVAARTHERGGVTLERGQTVYLSVAGANRDPAVYDRADDLRLDRVPGRPGISFGQGLHFCLGAALARLETRIAVPALLARFPDLALTGDDLSWEPQILTRAVRELPVSVGT